jgi:hypothetical protein
VSSLSNSADNSANEEDYDEEWSGSGDGSNPYDRMGAARSTAVSLPVQLEHGEVFNV